MISDEKKGKSKKVIPPKDVKEEKGKKGKSALKEPKEKETAVKKFKSLLHSRYYAEAVPSGSVHFRGLAPGQRRNIAAVVHRWRQWPVLPARESRPDLPHQ